MLNKKECHRHDILSYLFVYQKNTMPTAFIAIYYFIPPIYIGGYINDMPNGIFIIMYKIELHPLKLIPNRNQNSVLENELFFVYLIYQNSCIAVAMEQFFKEK